MDYVNLFASPSFSMIKITPNWNIQIENIVILAKESKMVVPILNLDTRFVGNEMWTWLNARINGVLWPSIKVISRCIQVDDTCVHKQYTLQLYASTGKWVPAEEEVVLYRHRLHTQGDKVTKMAGVKGNSQNWWIGEEWFQCFFSRYIPTPYSTARWACLSTKVA